MTDFEQFSPPDADGFRSKQMTSQNGVTFLLRTREVLGEQDQARTTTIPVAVNWPVVNTAAWKDAGKAKSRGIQLYRLRANNGEVYEWKLEFINTSGLFFTFTDASGDSYRISTIRDGEHEIHYNSPKPTIKYVD